VPWLRSCFEIAVLLTSFFIPQFAAGADLSGLEKILFVSSKDHDALTGDLVLYSGLVNLEGTKLGHVEKGHLRFTLSGNDLEDLTEALGGYSELSQAREFALGLKAKDSSWYLSPAKELDAPLPRLADLLASLGSGKTRGHVVQLEPSQTRRVKLISPDGDPRVGPDLEIQAVLFRVGHMDVPIGPELQMARSLPYGQLEFSCPPGITAVAKVESYLYALSCAGWSKDATQKVVVAYDFLELPHNLDGPIVRYWTDVYVL
jgi:hypothetical protein